MLNDFLSLPHSDDFINNTEIQTLLSETRQLLHKVDDYISALPHRMIILDVLMFLEAKDSAENGGVRVSNEEVCRYYNRRATKGILEIWGCYIAFIAGLRGVIERETLSFEELCELESLITGNKNGIRNVSVDPKFLLNTIYPQTPPDSQEQIELLVRKLLDYLNNDSLWELDPILKALVMYVLFKAIYPFDKGNTRLGKLVLAIYIYVKERVNNPAFCISRHIIRYKKKNESFICDDDQKWNWEKWIIESLTLLKTSIERTRQIAGQLEELIQSKEKLLVEYFSTYKKDTNFAIYQNEVLKIIFNRCCITPELMAKKCNIILLLAETYLDEFCQLGLIERQDYERQSDYGSWCYINRELVDYLDSISD